MARVPVRVRGMNAAAGRGAPLAGESERPQRFPHASMRQLVVAVALLCAAVAIARYTLVEVMAGPASFVGIARPRQSVNLDFAQTGRVAQVLVKPGDRVRKGQPLATQDQGLAKAVLADAQAALAADQVTLKALRSPTLSPADRAALDQQVRDVSGQVSAAQQASADAVARGGSGVGQAQQTWQDAVATRRADAALLAKADCPDAGDASADGSAADTGAPATGTASPRPTATTATGRSCAELTAQVGKDSAAVTAALANLTQAKATAAQLRDAAAGSLTSARSALALAQKQRTAAGAPASAADVSAAQAEVAAAQRVVDQDKQALGQLTLLSPIDGVIADVGGIAGELDSSDGVRLFAGPQALQSGSGPAFDLFPDGSAAASEQNGTRADQQPLITLVSAENDAVAQVSEDRIPRLRPGHAARVTVNALHRSVRGAVAHVVRVPVSQGGKVEYEVRVTVAEWPPGTEPGMSLSVTFP
ncbi:biotin/lipoyl-binding protein [Streptomyces sp. NPDC051976]|uniref:biotin/lipoyl-binding protein n=1 Tax=Streptomyces sp. NPDC051976 TaxID=3154947 RepID=UPI003443A5DA